MSLAGFCYHLLFLSERIISMLSEHTQDAEITVENYHFSKNKITSFILLIHIDRYIIYIPINIYIHISVLYTYYTKDINKIYTKTSQSMFK